MYENQGQEAKTLTKAQPLQAVYDKMALDLERLEKVVEVLTRHLEPLSCPRPDSPTAGAERADATGSSAIVLKAYEFSERIRTAAARLQSLDRGLEL